MSQLLANARRTPVSGTQQSLGSVAGGYSTFTGAGGFNYIDSYFRSTPYDVPSGTGARAGAQWTTGTNADPYGDYAFASHFGMMGSKVISATRQAMNMPLGSGLTPAPVGFNSRNSEGSIGTGNVFIDWAQGEKQSTVGTQEYFRSLNASNNFYQQTGAFHNPLSSNSQLRAQGYSYVGDGSGAIRGPVVHTNAYGSTAFRSGPFNSSQYLGNEPLPAMGRLGSNQVTHYTSTNQHGDFTVNKMPVSYNRAMSATWNAEQGFFNQAPMTLDRQRELWTMGTSFNMAQQSAARNGTRPSWAL